MNHSKFSQMLSDERVNLREVIINLIRTDSEMRAAIVQVLREDVSFELDCNSTRDYYSSGYNITLSIDGQYASSTSFSVD